jgi:hypothetical protein
MKSIVKIKQTKKEIQFIYIFFFFILFLSYMIYLFIWINSFFLLLDNLKNNLTATKKNKKYLFYF